MTRRERMIIETTIGLILVAGITLILLALGGNF